MTAPDPGLTDLIAAHRWDDRRGICECMYSPEFGPGTRYEWMGVKAWAAHVALVVEQHTNGRIAEPETTSEGGKRWYVNGYASVEFDAACDIWLNEVDPYVGDSGHARKLAAALHAAATAADDHRAALEGEQQ